MILKHSRAGAKRAAELLVQAGMAARDAICYVLDSLSVYGRRSVA